ncbi:hypothetical protein [Aliihoeflea sp. PC F10.4]
MTVRARIPTINRDIELMIAETLSPEAQGQHLADYAREQLIVAQDQNRAALGRVPTHETFVDGQERNDIGEVRANSQITFEFALLGEVLEWIGEQLVANSPVLSGRYANSHRVFADGVEAVPGAVPLDASEFVFVNIMPYARKIERGQSPQAPDGVYEAVSAVASRRFGNIARVRFSFRSIQNGGMQAYVPVNRQSSAETRAAHRRETDTRQPAIVVTL